MNSPINSLGAINVRNIQMVKLHETGTSASQDVTRIPSTSGTPISHLSEVDRGNLTGPAVNLNLALKSVTENMFFKTYKDPKLAEGETASITANQASEKLITAGKRSALLSGGVAFFASCLVNGPLALGIHSLAPVAGGVGGAAGLLAGIGFGFFIAVKLSSHLLPEHPTACGILLAIPAILTCVAIGMATGAIVGAVGGAVFGFSEAFILVQGASVGVFKVTLTFLEPFAAKLIGGRAEKQMDVDIVKLGAGKLGKIPNEEHIKLITVAIQEVRARAGVDLFKEGSSSIDDSGKLTLKNLSDEQKEAISPIIEELNKSCGGLEVKEYLKCHEEGMEEFKRQGLTSDDMQKLRDFSHKPGTQAMEYFYNNVFAPPIHEGLMEYAHYTDWTDSPDKESKVSRDTGSFEMQTLDGRNSPAPSSLEPKSSLIGKAVAAPVDFGKDVVGAVREIFHELGEAFKPKEDLSSRTLLQTVGKVAWTSYHANVTVLHRVTQQVFRLNTYTFRGEDIAKSKEVFGKIKTLAESGPAKGGFVNGNQAWENLHQMERRYGQGARYANPGVRAAIEGAKKAIRENYGSEGSLLKRITDTVTCHTSLEISLEGIVDEINKIPGFAVVELNDDKAH